MISKTLTKALEKNGFEYSDGITPSQSHAFAIYGGYLVTVYEQGTKKIAFINFKFNSDKDEFTEKVNSLGASSFDVTDDGLRLVSTGGTADFLALIDNGIALLQECEIKGAECCSQCSNKFGTRKPKKVTDGKENRIMCEHCAIEYLEESKNRASEKAKAQSNDKILPGILGAIGGALMGFLLYFFLYYSLSPALAEKKVSIAEFRYIFCIAGFFVSMLAYYGYRIFCKKNSVSAYVTVSASSIIFTILGQYIGIVFEFIAKNGIHISDLKNASLWTIHLRNTIPEDLAINFINYSEIFWKLLVISVLFSAVGSAMFLLSLHDKSIVKPEPIEVKTISHK